MSDKSNPLFVGDKVKTPATTSLSSLFTWFGVRGDYSKIPKIDRELTGWRRKVSTFTQEGRTNIALATYITLAVVGLYMWRKHKKSEAQALGDGKAK